MDNPEQQRHEAYLREWEVDLSPIEARFLQADKAAVDFSILGIKSAYILNGGALLGLPAFTSFLQIAPHESGKSLIIVACCFGFGLISAIITNILSYFTVCYFGVAQNYTHTVRANTLKLKYFGEYGLPGALEKQRAEATLAQDKADKKGRGLRTAAICYGVASSAAFVAGATLLLYQAWK